MVDIDHFKNINDTYGHLAGDQVIKMIGTCLKKNSRKYDICARYGGEEFVILTNMTLSVAEKLAEKIRKIVNDNLTHYGDTLIHVSASFGVASFNESDPITATEFQRRADAALYYSKTHGRNRVTLYSPDIEKQEEEEE
jgi:diguanylate cyclase (GGDEF)-like protein